MDEKRRGVGIDTSKGYKKAEAVTIPEDIAHALKQQPNTGQGRRDALIMCLLLDHGLRDSEIALLTRQNFELKRGEFTFYHPKVNRTQTYTMSPDTCRAAAAYFKRDAPADGILWRKSNKGTGILGEQLSERSATWTINQRVELLGRHAGIEGLSSHDGRQYAATYEARKGTPLDRLIDMFGWNSPAMAMRYI